MCGGTTTTTETKVAVGDRVRLVHQRLPHLGMIQSRTPNGSTARVDRVTDGDPGDWYIDVTWDHNGEKEHGLSVERFEKVEPDALPAGTRVRVKVEQADGAKVREGDLGTVVGVDDDYSKYINGLAYRVQMDYPDHNWVSREREQDDPSWHWSLSTDNFDVIANEPAKPRRFYLHRTEDVSGVSGTGVVAQGVRFPDGKVAVRWLGDRPSTVVWDSLDDAVAIHGHDGKTVVVWLDPEEV